MFGSKTQTTDTPGSICVLNRRIIPPLWSSLTHTFPSSLYYLFHTLALEICIEGELAWNLARSDSTGELINRGLGRRNDPILHPAGRAEGKHQRGRIPAAAGVTSAGTPTSHLHRNKPQLPAQRSHSVALSRTRSQTRRACSQKPSRSALGTHAGARVCFSSRFL